MIRRALRGDRESLAELLRRLESVETMIRGLHRRMGSPLDHGDLEDLTQDTLITIWNKLESFEGRAALTTWAYRFCFLGLLDRRRRARLRKQRTTSLEAAAAASAPEGASPSDRLALMDALAGLEEQESRVITLKHLADRTLLEISELLEIPQSTVKSHYYRGIENLKRVMTPPNRGRR